VVSVVWRKRGIDLSVHPSRLARERTRRRTDGPVAGIALRLIAADADPGTGMWFIAGDTPQTLTDGAGDFTFLGIAPGSYTLRVLRASQPTEPVLWAADSISVGADTDVTDLTVRLQTGAPIGGRLVVEGSGPPPAPVALKAIVIRPSPLPGTPGSMMGRPAGSRAQMTTAG
jgi:hypothetical protein